MRWARVKLLQPHVCFFLTEKLYSDALSIQGHQSATFIKPKLQLAGDCHNTAH